MTEMRDFISQDTGKRKVIERKLSVNCHACGENISCPDGQDFWFWIKSGDIIDFRKRHENCPQKLIGAQIDTTEIE